MQTPEIKSLLRDITSAEATAAWKRMVALMTRFSERQEITLPKPLIEWHAHGTVESRLIWQEIAAIAWMEASRRYPNDNRDFLDALDAGGPQTQAQADACNRAARYVRLLRRLVVKGCIARGEVAQEQEKAREQHKARVRAICAAAKAEGRDLNQAEKNALIGTIGEDLTDRVTFKRTEDGQTIVFIDGVERGPVEWN